MHDRCTRVYGTGSTCACSVWPWRTVATSSPSSSTSPSASWGSSPGPWAPTGRSAASTPSSPSSGASPAPPTSSPCSCRWRGDDVVDDVVDDDDDDVDDDGALIESHQNLHPPHNVLVIGEVVA